MTGVHLGADVGAGEWLAGVSVLRSDAETDYRFDRTVDACGGVGVGEGMLAAELTSVHPYAARRLGRGWVWAALGTGRGEASVERCAPGNVDEVDLKVRLAALGGRHPFAYRDRLAVSVVEDVGVLGMTTGTSSGPVGDRSVTVGRARVGLEAAGVAPPGCECSLATYVRALARGDWGDGATGAGLERGANVTLAILPKPDGSGLQAVVALRREKDASWFQGLDGISPWTAHASRERGTDRGWLAETRLGCGIATSRGVVALFAEVDAGGWGDGATRIGARHEIGHRHRGLLIEWFVERRTLSPAAAGNRFSVTVLGRF